MTNIKYLLIVIILAAAVGGGTLWYSTKYEIPTDNKLLVTEKPEDETDFLELNRDVLLNKLFPNLTFNNGIANHTAKHYEFLNLYLQDSIEDYFINTQERNILLIVRLSGVAHVGGLYHAYLGLFDKSGNLLTPVSPYPIPNHPNSFGDDYYDFFLDKAQFGGDQGDFGFYDCRGVKYIAFVSATCPNGTCCFGSVRVFRINKGGFEEVQTINKDSLVRSNSCLGTIIFPSVYAAVGPSYGLKMILSDEKIIVKKVPTIADERDCQETDYKVLNWNRNSCRFE